MALSELNPTSRAELLVPVVDTAIFDQVSVPAFWVGKVAVGLDAILPDEFLAARQLRAQVYVDELGYLPPSARMDDGGELDEDDPRSVHFAVIEHTDTGLDVIRGNTRLIKKAEEDDTLPVEKFFPDVFQAEPAPRGSVEASRFIARHENRIKQHAIMLSMVRTMVANAAESGSPYIYAVVENHLEHLFSKINLAYDVLSEPIYLEEYKSDNMALRFDPIAVLSQVDTDQYGQEIMQMFFATARENLGEGHYDETLINNISNQSQGV